MMFWKSRTYSFFLWPESVLFGLAIRIRNWLYDRGILPSHRLNAKVVSIGNLTVGGTGKTPFVQWIARLLSQKGFRTAVLSRGYGGTGKGTLAVSDGKYIQTGARLAGDEPVLLAKRLPGVPVVVSPNRVRAGEYAIRHFQSNMLILDDAFQHRRLKRDLDIVLLNADFPFGNGWLLPAGPLREPLSSLRRADVVVLTGSDDAFSKADLTGITRWTQAPVLFAKRRPTAWILHGTDRALGLDHLKGRPVLAFAGIGNPKSFQETVLETGATVSRFIPFADHYFYQAKDRNRIAKLANELDVRAVVTTEKDGVRIGSWNSRAPLYCLRIEMEWVGGNALFEQVLRKIGE